jgi:O-antigen ligase
MPEISLPLISRFLGLMLLAWQPFFSGPRLPSLLLCCIGLWLLARRQVDFSRGGEQRLGLAFVLLLVPVLISLPGSFDLKGSLLVVLGLSIFFCVGLALLAGLRRPQDLAWLNRWLLVVVLAWVLDGFVQLALGVDLLGHPILADGRILGPFQDNLRLGLFVTLLMPLVLWDLTRRRPLLSLLLILAIGVIAALSGARTNLYFLLLGLALLLPLFSWRYRLSLALGLVLVLLAGFALSPVMNERMDRFTAMAQGSEQGLFQRLDHVLSGRMSIWNTGLRMARQRPLTGVGAGAFEEAYPHFAPEDDLFLKHRPYHAHNMYVSVLAESGLPGLLALLLLAGLILRWMLQAPPVARARAAPYAASLAVIAFPVSSQPVLFSMWWFPLPLLLLTGLLAALQQGKESPGPA